MLDRKLKFEIIPDGCWKYNLRNILSTKLWNFLKNDAKDRAGNKCAICGAQSARLEAHEVWDYDVSNGIIALKDILSICPLCHKAIHINRTYLTGDFEKAENQYMSVNGVSYSQMKNDLKLANELNQLRNKVSEWKMDLSWLKNYTK